MKNPGWDYLHYAATCWCYAETAIDQDLLSYTQFSLFLLLLESLNVKLLYSYIVVESVAAAGGGAERRGVVVPQGLRRPVLWSRGIDVVECRLQ